MSEYVCMDAESNVTEVEFGRFGDLTQRFGIRRSTAYKLIAAGKIRSAVVRKKGARNGIRLIDFGSVRDFLRISLDEKTLAEK